ncbi:hypothetical protein ANRL1_04379 [Anaerolineae bacterium]|nr:hypothetical protein ANRL1_04379 [Anaerolineae bacterium]
MNHATRSHYHHSIPRLFIPFLRAVLGIRSSIRRDGALLLQGAHPTPRVLNSENIPADSPFLLAVNHYDRPGLGAWWGAALIIGAIAARRPRDTRELHFTMAAEWWYPRGFGRVVKQPLTRLFFGQLAKAYGLLTLPPVVEEYRGQAAPSIRRALTLVRGDAPELVGLAPEGHTGPNLALCEPPAGAGLFLLLLAHDQIPILPVGLYEDDDATLTAKFGAPFDLCVPRTLERAARDRKAVRAVMIAIGKLLPARMWGAYRDVIASDLSEAISRD